MHSRYATAAFAAIFAMTFAAPIAAEPAKVPAQVDQPATQSDNRPAELLLASREIRTPGQQSDGQASPPPKRPRAARVTSCRCGGQTTPQQP